MTTLVTWRGLTFSGEFDGTPFGVRTLEGWEDRPVGRQDSPARPAAHGRFDGAAWRDERIVTLTGQFADRERRDELLMLLDGVMTWGSSGGQPEDLTITKAGRTLTARARLTDYRPDTSTHWASGVVPYAIQWRCPDPLRYGDVVSATTGFPEEVGGLQWPLTYPLDYGDASTTGRVTLTNPGTADTWPQFQVAGPVPAAGFEVVEVGTGRRLRFEGAVPAGSALVLDAATGTAVIDGVADRGGLLTWRDWTPVPAGGSVTFAFVPLGPFSGAVLTASCRPAYW